MPARSIRVRLPRRAERGCFDWEESDTNVRRRRASFAKIFNVAAVRVRPAHRGPSCDAPSVRFYPQIMSRHWDISSVGGLGGASHFGRSVSQSKRLKIEPTWFFSATLKAAEWRGGEPSARRSERIKSTKTRCAPGAATRRPEPVEGPVPRVRLLLGRDRREPRMPDNRVTACRG